MKYAIPQVYRSELEAIWKVDRRLPTLRSRRKWCEARRLNPQHLHRWYSRKRLSARRKHVELPPDSDMYDLEVGTPPIPEPIVKIEAREICLKSVKLTKWPESGVRRSRRIAMISKDPLSSPNTLSSFGSSFAESTLFTSPHPERRSSCSLTEASRIARTPSRVLSMHVVPTPRSISPDLSDASNSNSPLHYGLSLTSTLSHDMDPASKPSKPVQPQGSLECSQGSSNADSDYICALCSKASDLCGANDRPGLSRSSRGLLSTADTSPVYSWNDTSQVQFLYSLYPSYFSCNLPFEPVLLLTRPPTPLKGIPATYHYSDIFFDSQASGPRDTERLAYSCILAHEFPDFRFSSDGFHLCSSRCSTGGSCTYFSLLCDMAERFQPAFYTPDDVLPTNLVDHRGDSIHHIKVEPDI